MRDWCRDGDSNSGLPVEGRRVLATRRSRRIGSPTRTRTWIDRLTAGRPTVARSGNWWSTSDSNRAQSPCKGDPRTPRVPRLGLPRGPDPLAPRARSDGETGLTPANRVVPGVGFEPTSPRLQRGAFTRLASQANVIGAADGNRTHVCAWATHGSAIELRTLVHRAGLEPAKHIGT